MRKTNNKQRKGFTIVELVIVIAVIAILAGVMIPTFGGIIETANRSADTQLVAQINTILTVQDILTGGVNDAVEIQKFVEENGLKLETKSKGSLLLYDKSSRRVVLGTLVEGSDEVIITDPSAGTVAKVIISGDRPVLLSDGSGNGAAVVVNNKNDSSNTAKFRQGITLLDEFIEGYLNITKKSRDGLAQAICDIRDATDWDDITKENGLLSKITKINPTLGNNLATYMSQVAIITTGEEIISSGNLASAKYLLVNSGVTKITQTIVDKLEDCENISIIDFSSNITEIESEDVFEALDDLGKKISINNEEIKKLDDEKDPTSTNNIFHVSERDLHVEKLVLVHRIDGTNIGTGEKIAEYGKDVVDYPVNLPYQVYPCTTANKAYKFKGYSFYEDGSNSIQYGATDYPLSEQQRAMAVGGQLTIYAIYEQVDADFMVGTSYYESAGMTYKLSKGAITSGTITVVSTKAVLDASLIGLANAKLEIPESVTLHLPYKTSDSFSNDTGAKDQNDIVNSDDQKYSTVNKLNVEGDTKLTIANNVTLNNKGKIYVDAQLYYTGTNVQAHIKNTTCAVLVVDGTLETTGTLYAYGVVRGAGEIIASEGQILELLTILDWPGGTIASSNIDENVSPFNNWLADNIRAKMTLKKGVKYLAFGAVSLSVVGTQAMEFVLVDDTTSTNPLFLMEGADAEVQKSYGDGYKLDIIAGTVKDTKKEVSVSTYTIKFYEMAMPLPNFDITVKAGATLELNNNLYKVLPGSEVVVEEAKDGKEAGKLTINTQVAFFDTFDLKMIKIYKNNQVLDDGWLSYLKFKTSTYGNDLKQVTVAYERRLTSGSGSCVVISYPKTAGYDKPASLMVNGELSFGAKAVFTGNIDSSTSGAKITINANAKFENRGTSITDIDGVTHNVHGFKEGVAVPIEFGGVAPTPYYQPTYDANVDLTGNFIKSGDLDFSQIPTGEATYTYNGSTWN